MYTVAIIPSTVGYHWEELFDAYLAFREASWRMLFYTVDGKTPVADPNSIKKRPVLSYIGMGVRSSFSPDSKLGQALLSLLNTNVQPIEALETSKVDAIYIPGGHGVLFDVNINHIVHEKILAIYHQGKPIGAVCHGSSCLAFVKEQGNAIIKGKRVIGFLDAMDSLLISLNLIDKRFLPLPYQNEKALVDAGAKIGLSEKALALLNPAYYLIDKPFVTGVGPKAAGNVAKAMMVLEENKSR